MIDPVARQLWTYRALFVVLSGLIIFMQLIPLHTVPAFWAGPDVLVAMVYAWVIRRGDYVPVVLIATVFLIADFLLQSPPGLKTALIVLTTEFLRRRAPSLREISFVTEWAMAAGLMLVLLVGYRLSLIMLLTPRPPLGLHLTQLVTTIAAYPLVVAVTRRAVGVIRPATTDTITAGQRA